MLSLTESNELMLANTCNIVCIKQGEQSLQYQHLCLNFKDTIVTASWTLIIINYCGYILFFKQSNKKRKVLLPGYKLNYPHMPGFFYPLSKLCANDFIAIDNYSKPLKLLCQENTSFKLIMHLSAQTEHTMYILVFRSKKILWTSTLVCRSNSYVMLFPWQPPISILFGKIFAAS